MSGKTYHIRWALDADWTPAMYLAWRTFVEFDAPSYKPKGVLQFFRFVTDPDLHSAFNAGNYKMLVALDRDKVIGLASVRSHNFLSLLFVDKEYQHMGVATRLLEELTDYLKSQGESLITVKATPYAHAFYLKTGFRDMGPESEIAGMRVIPMTKYL